MADTSFPHPNGILHEESIGKGRPLKAAIIGGSLDGLYAGLALIAIGCDVEIYEQPVEIPPDHGGWLITQNEMDVFLAQHGIAIGEAAGITSWIRQRIDLYGNLLNREAAFRKYVAWDTLYHQLRRIFPKELYHTGSRLAALDQEAGNVQARFEDGREVICDLLVGADGILSDCRNILLPGLSPEYAGYMAWRGTAPEKALRERTVNFLGEKHTLYQGYRMQMISCMIPGPNGETEVGERRIAWEWYVNVPEGDPLRDVMTGRSGQLREMMIGSENLREEIQEKQIQMARALLPPMFLELFEQTEKISVRKIIDLAVPQMVFGRACLIGEAAFILRPHAILESATITSDAITLAQGLQEYKRNVVAALKAWEPERLAQGRRLQLWGKALGNQAMQMR